MRLCQLTVRCEHTAVRESGWRRTDDWHMAGHGVAVGDRRVGDDSQTTGKQLVDI